MLGSGSIVEPRMLIWIQIRIKIHTYNAARFLHRYIMAQKYYFLLSKRIFVLLSILQYVCCVDKIITLQTPPLSLYLPHRNYLNISLCIFMFFFIFRLFFFLTCSFFSLPVFRFSPKWHPTDSIQATFYFVFATYLPVPVLAKLKHYRYRMGASVTCWNLQSKKPNRVSDCSCSESWHSPHCRQSKICLSFFKRHTNQGSTFRYQYCAVPVPTFCTVYWCRYLICGTGTGKAAFEFYRYGKCLLSLKLIQICFFFVPFSLDHLLKVQYFCFHSYSLFSSWKSIEACPIKKIIIT